MSAHLHCSRCYGLNLGKIPTIATTAKGILMSAFSLHCKVAFFTEINTENPPALSAKLPKTQLKGMPMNQEQTIQSRVCAC